METKIRLERWDHPFVKAQPSGFDYIELNIQEPSATTYISITVPIDGAQQLAEHIQKLVNTLRPAKLGHPAQPRRD